MSYNDLNLCEIKITKGYVALVDAEDFLRINSFNWFANEGLQVRAARMSRGKIIYMQHQVLEVMPWELSAIKREIDHENRNSLHNWKKNLRIVTHQENMLNTLRHKNRVGICFNKRANLWMAYLDEPKMPRKYLGYRKTKEAAEALVTEARNACR